MSQHAQPTPVTTDCGIPVEPLYSPATTKLDHADIGDPGTFPFTRGNFPSGYRHKLWTFRQYSGFGTAAETNARYKYLLASGGTGLSVAADLPTQIGYDSDDPDVTEEVGRVGVALDTLADAEILFDGIPLDRVSTSWTVHGTAAIMLAFYVAVGKQQGVPVEKLRGTIQNDILKEYVARGTWIWPPEPSIRLIVDTIEFCARHVPRYNAISVAGAHFRDAGCTAAQEMAFTLADGVTYVDAVLERGRMTIDEFAPQVSFFFYTHSDFFEEIAKYRAGRRRWARLVKERWGAQNDSSCLFRMGCVAGGSTLYAPQAHNNIVRVAYETGVARTVDPLGGSWFVESLTDAMEEQLVAIMADVDDHGGMVRAIEDGYVQGLIAEEAWKAQRLIESGERPIVGVNIFQTDEPPADLQIYGLDADGRRRQLDRLAEVKASRNGDDVRRVLKELQTAAEQPDVNLMPLLVEAVEAYATVGEITQAVRDVWGEYRQPVVY